MAEDTITSSKEDGTWGAQLSVKFGNNCMINLRAKDVEALILQAGELRDGGSFLVDIAEDFQSHAISAQTAIANVQAVFPETQPVYQPAAPGPVGGGPVCAHGVPMAYRSGNKNGKSWSGNFCTVKNDPRMPECAPRFNR